MNNNQKKIISLRQKLIKSSEKQSSAIKNTIIGTSSFLFITPICVLSMNEENIPIAILSFLEIGAIYLPLNGIKDMLQTKQEMKITRKQIKKQQKITPSEDIMSAYTIIREDLDQKIRTETKNTKIEKLKKLRNKCDEIYGKL